MMKQEDIERLKYRRQYLLTPEEIACPFLFNYYHIGKSFHLYAHIDLNVTHYSRNETTLILLGDIFDYKFPRYGNLEILQELIDDDLMRVAVKTSRYTGRFVLICADKDNMIIFTDATATRKVFHSHYKSQVWLASQPHLLARVIGLPVTGEPSRLAYYDSDDFVRMLNSNIGNTTHYDEVFQLLPNHLYDVYKLNIYRFWPDHRLERNPLPGIAERCATIIKGYLESIALRYDIMLPVTAGKDSRVLLAGTKEIRDRVYYYTNKDRRLTNSSPDIYIPHELLTSLHLQFHMLSAEMPVDEDFQRIYFDNNPYANKAFLPAIYNYYLHFAGKVNLPGNFASGGMEHYKCHVKSPGVQRLARLNGVNKYAFAKEYYSNWLTECREICAQNQINIIDLFYWEERLCNWGTQIQLEKDIAQEDVNVYNSRLLIELFLSVDKDAITPPDYVLQRKIIRRLWPEALIVPINPSITNKLRYILKYTGLLDTLYKLRCFFDTIFGPI